VSTIHAAQSITRLAAILVLRSRGPWVIYSMTDATLSWARLVHPAQIFMRNHRYRMCLSAIDCVIDVFFLGFPIFVRARTGLFFLSERLSFAMSYLRQWNEAIYGEFAKSLPRNSREYILGFEVDRQDLYILGTSPISVKCRWLGSRLVSRLNVLRK